MIFNPGSCFRFIDNQKYQPKYQSIYQINISNYYCWQSSINYECRFILKHNRKRPQEPRKVFFFNLLFSSYVFFFFFCFFSILKWSKIFTKLKHFKYKKNCLCFSHGSLATTSNIISYGRTYTSLLAVRLIFSHVFVLRSLIFT